MCIRDSRRIFQIVVPQHIAPAGYLQTAVPWGKDAPSQQPPFGCPRRRSEPVSYTHLTSGYIAITSFLRVTGCPLFAVLSAQNIQSQTLSLIHISEGPDGGLRTPPRHRNFSGRLPDRCAALPYFSPPLQKLQLFILL